MKLGRLVAAGLVAATALTVFTLGQTEATRVEQLVATHSGANSIVSSGGIQLGGGVQVAGVQSINANGTIDATRIVSGGTVPDAALSANIPRLNAGQTFAVRQTFGSGYTISGGYPIIANPVTLSFSGSGASIDPGSAAMVFLNATAPGSSVATIGSVADGRLLRLCMSGNAVTFVTGGNIVAGSGSMAFGTCVAMLYHGGTSAWWYFD